MKRFKFAAPIYARDGARCTGGRYPTLRRAIRCARAECRMIGGAKYDIHRWCPYTGDAELVVESDVPKNRLIGLALLALTYSYALGILIAGMLK